MTLKEIIGLILFSFLYVCNAGKQVPHGYMTVFYYNKRQVVVNDSFVLELSNRFLPADRKDYLTCDIDIVTSPNRRLMIHFVSLEIAEEKQFLDRLHIYDYKSGQRKVRITPKQGLYGLYNKYYNSATGVADYRSTGNRLKLDYQGMPTLEYNGFKILITSFTETHDACGPKFVRCNYRDICVPASTFCDGYSNCGTNDAGDETNCDYRLGNAWQPWDGQITAVVAASVSCTVFLIVAAVIFIVITKYHKREIINNTNITVEFRKKRKTKKSDKSRQANSEAMTRLYAPPSYEVVVSMNEDPPPYQAVAGEFETDSDTDSESHVLEAGGGFACVSLPSNTEKGGEIIDNNNTNIRVTSALVTCDIEGNNLCTTDACDQVRPDKGSQDFEEMTKFKPLPCNGSESNLRKVTVVDHDTNEIEVLEHHSSNEDVSSDCNGHINNGNLTNGSLTNGSIVNGGSHVKTNGVSNGNKHNGYTKVMYTRSPSKREADMIEYVDSD